jgi:hypothetical protein
VGSIEKLVGRISVVLALLADSHEHGGNGMLLRSRERVDTKLELPVGRAIGGEHRAQEPGQLVEAMLLEQGPQECRQQQSEVRRSEEPQHVVMPLDDRRRNLGPRLPVGLGDVPCSTSIRYIEESSIAIATGPRSATRA